jgi:hypothetical protein
VHIIREILGLLLGERRGLAAFDDMLWPAHRVRGVDGEDLADDQPVEQHADGGKVQLDGRLGRCRLQHLYIGGDVDRLDVGKLADFVLLNPGEEVARGPVIARAGVLVADGRSEELDEASRCMIAISGSSDSRVTNASSTCLACASQAAALRHARGRIR